MNRDEWLAWRKQGLGSSDAPIVMEMSPWCTPYRLWEIKTGVYEKPETSNRAIERGNALEPKARAQYELEQDIDMPAKLVVHARHSWLRASLDGYNEAEKRILEIKCPGAADHALACSGVVPGKYWPQIQHQLLVTGANCVDYYSFDGHRGVAIRVLPDLEYCTSLFIALRDFWKMVESRTPPPLTERDVVRVRDSNLKFLASQWLAAKQVADGAAEAELCMREELVEAIERRSGTQPGLIIDEVKAFRQPQNEGHKWILKGKE